MIKTSDIVNKVFNRAFMGYDIREVDAFLDELIEELEALQKDRLTLTRSLERAMLQLEQYRALEAEGETLKLPDARQPRRLGQPRRIGLKHPETGRQESVEELVEAVALEIETGSAAPLYETEMEQAMGEQITAAMPLENGAYPHAEESES